MSDPRAAADVVQRLRAIALALPETHEEVTWGDINFRVRTKIFCSPGPERFAVKVANDQLIGLLEDPRFELAPYWGRFGWVRVRLDPPIDWDEVTALIHGSYRLIAPKALARLV
jgi:predicted DNA-binding protein (MmcQ/YjbR family)